MEYEIKELSEQEVEVIQSKLDEYLEAMVPAEPGTPEHEEFVLCVKDDDGNVIAGAIVNIYMWGRAVLSTLWAEEKYRGEGLGSMLIKEAERMVKEKGCRVMCLATVDFMARPFYEKHGYKVFTVNKDLPKGHEGWSMMKWMEEGITDYVPSHNSAASTYKVEVGGKEEARKIHGELTRFNEANVPPEHDEIMINKKIVDKDGNLIAGISGMAGDWNACSVDVLWVDEPYRRKGLGSCLLKEIEEEAKKCGTYIMLADAEDWCVDFFKKNGYTIRGTLEDYPKGHSGFELEKRI